MTEGPYKLPSGWQWVRIAEVCEVNPRRPQLNRQGAQSTSFVPMNAIDESAGKIVDFEARPYAKVQRGYTYFGEGDVLFAKITPCMQNGKSAIARGLIDGFGFGSTEFHVLRPKEFVLAEWILLFVRQELFREKARLAFRGAVGQQRVPQEFVENYPFPLPSLDEQRRIVAKIDSLMERIREARRLRAEAIIDVKMIMDSVLSTSFSDLSTKYKNLELGELSTRITKGESPRWQGFSYVNEGPLFIRSENVLWGSLELSNPFKIPLHFHEKLKRSQLRSGDVLVNLVGASIGRACVVPQGIGPANLNQAVSVISTDARVLLPEFLVYYIISPLGQKIIHGGKVEAARANISLGDLRNLSIPLPPLAEQSSAVLFVKQAKEKLTHFERAQQKNDSDLQCLEHSILHKAFRGEL